MRRLSTPIRLFIGLALAVIIWPSHADAQHHVRQAVPHQVIVKLAKATRTASPSLSDKQFMQLGKRYKVVGVARLAKQSTRRSVTAADEIGISSIYRVRYGADVDPAAVAAEYANCPGVEYAEPDYVRRVEWTPNDTLYGQQYGLGLMSAPAAWDITRGSSDIVIAVSDTGVDTTHPEFAGKLVAGYDFVDDDADPLDLYGHGTHVAGIAAATANNAIGIAGVAPNCKIMPIRVLDATGSGYVSDCAEGVIWAADNGANVINMSYGSYTFSSVEYDAIAYAIRAGVVCVSSKGNDSSSDPHYPSDYPGVISVGATDSTDVDCWWSNWGATLWIMAPGDLIVSTTPTYDVTMTGAPDYLPRNYGTMSGTSMASPQVAGAAALLLSTNPALTPYEVAYFLGASADDLNSVGYDTTSGFGRVDIERAINAVLDDMVHDVAIDGAVANPSTPGPHTLSALRVDVANNGNTPEAPMSVSVYVDGVLLDEQTVTVWPGERATVSFAWTPTEARTYEITATCEPAFGTDASPADNTYTFDVTPEANDVGITGIEMVPTPSYAGNWARLRISVVNNGSYAETEARVRVLVAGSQVDAIKLVPIGAGATTQVDFFWMPPVDASTYFLSTPTAKQYAVTAQVTSGRGTDASPGNNTMTRTMSVDAHNISVTDVRLATSAKVGVAQTIRVTVKNNGTRTETLLSAKVYVDGVLVGPYVSTTLAPGATTVVPFAWTPTQYKSYKIEARSEPPATPDISRSDNYRCMYVTAR